MKYLILIGLIYGVYRVSQVAKAIDTRKQPIINQEKDDGFTDYEEVD